ncbi:MAG: hypothetical protein QME79_11135 [Bacillota bacterium]|nr:hypothetical protein [Bacillota bacterium]
MHVPDLSRRRILRVSPGVSLVEVLVAISVTGFLVAVFVNALSLGLRSQAAANSRYIRDRSWQRAESQMLDGTTGLRAAGDVEVAAGPTASYEKAFAFSAGGRNVTYRYLVPGRTYTVTGGEPVTVTTGTLVREETAGSSATITTGPGQVVLEGLLAFDVTLAGETVALSADLGQGFAPTTTIRLRNL